jgi:amidophosphoribosyltransferase
MADVHDTPFSSDGDGFHDECGVFGIFGRHDAAAIVALGLHALQHRGQEAAGIVSFDGSQFHVERHVGLIGDNLHQAGGDRQPEGQPRHRPYALCHHRRRGACATSSRCFAELADGGFAVAHNGNLTNAMTVQRTLQKQGAIFTSTSDTETILHLAGDQPGARPQLRASSTRSARSRARSRSSRCRRRR